MGELVVFRPRADECRRIAASDMNADILFFTGVRIERGEASQIAPKVAPKTRSRRIASRSETPSKRRDRKP